MHEFVGKVSMIISRFANSCFSLCFHAVKQRHAQEICHFTCPSPMQVVSDRMTKSVLVAVKRLKAFPKYRVTLERMKKFMVRLPCQKATQIFSVVSAVNYSPLHPCLQCMQCQLPFCF